MGTMTRNNEFRHDSFASLAGGIVEDVQDLFKLELSMARHEMKEDLERAKIAGVYFGIACVSLLVGVLLTASAIAQMLSWLGMPQWAGYLTVGLVFLAAAAAAMATAKSKAEGILPDETVDTLKENVRWIKKHA